MKTLPHSTLLLFALFLSFSPTRLKAETPLPPAPSKYVTDYARVLSGGVAQRLSGELEDFDHRAGSEILMVIFPNLPSGVSIGDYAQRLYQTWNVGRHSKQTGVLLLIVTRERQGRIEPGPGLKAKLPEETCRSIFLGKIAPRLESGDYDGACKAAANALMAAAR
jgi:uncharacterized protein